MQIGETVMFLDHEEIEREGVIESINETTAQIGSSKALYIIPVSSILWSISAVLQEMENASKCQECGLRFCECYQENEDFYY